MSQAHGKAAFLALGQARQALGQARQAAACPSSSGGGGGLQQPPPEIEDVDDWVDPAQQTSPISQGLLAEHAWREDLRLAAEQAAAPSLQVLSHACLACHALIQRSPPARISDAFASKASLSSPSACATTTPTSRPPRCASYACSRPSRRMRATRCAPRRCCCCVCVT